MDGSAVEGIGLLSARKAVSGSQHPHQAAGTSAPGDSLPSMDTYRHNLKKKL